MIYYGKQSINQDDIEAVINVLKSDFLTQGSKIQEFESELSNYCGVKHATVVNNGTAALHLAYLALGVGQGDIVWTVANTFVATANAALYCGAKVDFVDINPETYNISIKNLKEKLARAERNNTLPKVVVPVHFAGQSCEMRDIWELSRKYNFSIVEDACHALGGEYLGKKVGCCEYSDVSVFSFHPVKMITTGEGGAITTNSSIIDNKMKLLRSHGITKKSSEFRGNSDGDWYYEQHELGFNYRLTDIQGALGISQLKRLDEFVTKRRNIAERYFDSLKKDVLPYQHPDSESSWHLFVLRLNNRDKIYSQLKNQGIVTQVHYIPVTSQPFYEKNTPENSKNFYQACLSIPIYADLSIDQQNEVVHALSL